MASSHLARVHLFPVRHHSPRSTAMLGAFLDAHQPKVVLVEGPSDATALIDILVDEKTEPPIAVLGYATEGEPASALWPFAAYSPEWHALHWAKHNGATARFIDVPVGMSLARDAAEAERRATEAARLAAEAESPSSNDGEQSEASEPTDAAEPAPAEAKPAESLDPLQAAAEARGFRGFEELWEACFEAPDYQPEQFREALLAHAQLVRTTSPSDWHQARDAFMAQQIEQVIEQGTAPEQIVAVFGAAHAAAFVEGDVDPQRITTLPEPRPSAVTIIPYSFPRLAAQLGYGAGNRAPQYYQLAHDAGCDFRQATLLALLGFGSELRSRGFAASMADTIEAYRLAQALASLRDKAEPGLDELRESCIATMCRGDAHLVDAFLWQGVLGHRVGKVAERIGKNSLQEEFWRELNERDLPRDDRPREVVAKMREPAGIGLSVFLHRLRVMQVPYATFQGTYEGMAGNRSAQSEPGGTAALTRLRESWLAQWTPSTDVALVETIALGNSIAQVTAQILGTNLEEATSTGEAAAVLMEAVVTASPRTAADAMLACDTLAATDDDLPSLARACQSLSGLVSYGSSRDALPGHGSQATLRALCRKTFARAVLRVRPACMGDDDATAPVPRALQTLHEVALAQPEVDRDAWLTTAKGLVEDYTIHPRTAGVAAALLYLARIIEEDEVATLVAQRLSDTLNPLAAAAFLEGFLQVNATVLVRNRAVVETLDQFVCAVGPDAFRNILPLLRRAFGSLGSSERRTFLENLIQSRGLQDQARQAIAVLTAQDEAALTEVAQIAEDALSEFDDFL